LKRVDYASFGTADFANAFIQDSGFFFTYTLSTQDKWPEHQEKLREFFIGNPSPIKKLCPLMGDPLLQLPSAQNTAATHIGLGVNPSTQNLPSSGVSPPNVLPNAATIGVAQATPQMFDLS
jgi:hypothetical protein